MKTVNVGAEAPSPRRIISTQMFTHDLTTELCLLGATSENAGDQKSPELTVVCLQPGMWSSRGFVSERTRANTPVLPSMAAGMGRSS